MIGKYITILFFVFLLLGAGLGTIRGLKKSTLRFLTVFLCCFLTASIVSLFTQAILDIDIAKMGMEVPNGGKTLEDAIISYLYEVPIIQEMLEMSPTSAKIVVQLPKAIINIVLFVLVFFVLKSILWIIYAIIAKIAFKKKNANGDPVRLYRGWGTLIGAVQGILVFATILLPIVGTINFLSSELNYIEEYQKSYNTVQTASYTNPANGKLNYTSQTAEENDSVISEDSIEDAQNIFSDISSNWVIKTFNVLGYEKLSKNTFDKLTSMTINEKETTLSKEIDCIVKVYVRVDRLKNLSLQTITEKDVEVIEEVIDITFSSGLIPSVANEVIVATTTAWTEDGSAVLGLAKPQVEGEIGIVVDSLISSLSKSTTQTLKQDLLSITKTTKILIKGGVIEDIANNKPTDELLKTISEGDTLENTISAMVEGSTMKNVMPSLMQVMLDYTYPLLNIEEAKAETLKINRSAESVNWNTEKVCLSKMLSSFVKVADSLPKENEKVVDTLDFESVGVALNNIQESQLLNCPVEGSEYPLYREIISAFIGATFGENADELEGIILGDSSNKIDYVKTMKTVKSSLELADSLQDATKEPTPENIKNVLEGLDDENVSEVIESIVDSVGEEAGASEEVKNISSIVTSVVEYNKMDDALDIPTEEEDLNNATTAVESLYDVVSGSASEGSSNAFFATEQDFNDFINSISGSDYVYNVTINNGIVLGFKQDNGVTNLSSQEYDWVENYVAENPSQSQDMIKLFGIETSTLI